MTRKEFREYLNNLPGVWRGRNSVTGRPLGARTEKYGDYLYRQDRPKFEADYADYLEQLTRAQRGGMYDNQ